MSDESKMLQGCAPPPVGTVVEYEGYVCRVRSGSLMPIDAPGHSGWWEDQVDWSRVTVVPVPEGWEVVATKEEATPHENGIAYAGMVSNATKPWTFDDDLLGRSPVSRYIWLRRKPAEQQFKPTDKQRELMNTPTKTNGFMTTGALTVPTMDGIIEAARRLSRTCARCGEVNAVDADTGKCVTCKPAKQPAPVDVPVLADGRYKDAVGDILEVRGDQCCWMVVNGVGQKWRPMHTADVMAEGHSLTRLPDEPAAWPTCGGGLLCHGGSECSLHVRPAAMAEPAAPAFVPRVATWSDCKPGAEYAHLVKVPVWRVTNVRDDGNDCEHVRTGRNTHTSREAWEEGRVTLIRPAPEAQAETPKFDPRALRKGDVVGFYGTVTAMPVAEVDARGESVLWDNAHSSRWLFDTLNRRAVSINGTPLYEWVATVQPGRLGEARSPGGGAPAEKQAQVPENTGAHRGGEAIVCAACSKPITGRPLELDEGAVTLCSGDACVNAYARMHAPKRYDPDAEREACKKQLQSYVLTEFVGRVIAAKAVEERVGAEREAMAAAARDAHEANRYHRAPLLDGVWTKGRL